MFEQRLWAWQFDKYETTGAASRFAHVNQERLEGKNGELTMDEVTRVSSISCFLSNMTPGAPQGAGARIGIGIGVGIGDGDSDSNGDGTDRS